MEDKNFKWEKSFDDFLKARDQREAFKEGLIAGALLGKKEVERAYEKGVRDALDYIESLEYLNQRLASRGASSKSGRLIENTHFSSFSLKDKIAHIFAWVIWSFIIVGLLIGGCSCFRLLLSIK